MKKQESVWNELYKKGLIWKRENVKIKEIMMRKSVLELGVGNGKTLKSIIYQKPKEITAIDISKEAINVALKSVKYDNIEFLEDDFLNFKTDKRWDVIVCYYFLNNFKKNERIKAVKKMKELLNNKGRILFEDFNVGDLRQKGKIIEKNTIERQNGLICHFFEKKEILNLFKDFGKIQIKEKILFPIRTDKKLKRKIINASIRN